VLFKIEVGVPEITQVLELMLAQFGREVVPLLILQPEIEAPFEANVEGIIVMNEPKFPMVPVDPE